MKKEILVGTNYLAHDSSVIYLDEEKEDIFAIENERISRFKHDGISVSIGLIELKKYLKIENKKINWILSFCYENEDLIKRCDHIWKRNILLYEIRKIFDIKEIKEQVEKLKISYSKLFFHSLLKFPISMNYIYYSILYYIFYKNKNLPFKKNVNYFTKIDFKRILKDEFEIKFNDHHTTHSASAYYLSPFKKCISISLDFFGDNSFSKVFLFNNEKMIELVNSKAEKDTDNNIVSIGGIYTYCTQFLGFTPNSDEGKVEALAAYGNKNNDLYKKLVNSTSINNLNQIKIDNQIIKYLKKELGYFKNKIGKEDIAAAVQGYLEDFMTLYVKKIISEYQITDIVFSGGTFANVKLNMNIFEKSGLKNMYVVPAMSDAGAGLGALLLSLIEKKKIKYDFFKKKKFKMPYWGPKYDKDEIKKKLVNYSEKIIVKVLDKKEWHSEFAKRISNDQIGGLFQGRMEFGPRALGNRSIIGNASNDKTRYVLNKIIKGRPNFQPFCPSILEEDRNILFEKSYPNKHMTCAFKMKEEYVKHLPSAVHVDNTARPQFVEKEDNENFYLILKEIKKIIGFGVVVNTSFNKHGRTMVLTPDDAIKDFLDSKMDFIFFEEILVTKK